MKILKLPLLSLFLLTGSILLAEPAPVSPAAPSDQLAEALPILKAGCFLYPELQIKEGDRLSDVIARSKGAVSLVQSPIAFPPSPILTTLLPDNIAYWRLASFAPKTNWVDLSAQLDGWTQLGAAGIVLDLRSNLTPDDYAGADQVGAFFGRGRAYQFVMQSSGAGVVTPAKFRPAQPFRQPVVILVNHQTSGAAEGLAESLKRQGALVIGQSTPGTAAYFEQKRLASGQILRYFAAFADLADGTVLWEHPVVPDLVLTADDRAETVLALIGDGQVLDVIQETPERHLLSEASLVQGQDPEWDNYLASLERKPVLLSVPVIHDAALIRALDSLKAIRLSQRTLPAQTTATASLPSSSSVQ